MEKVVFFLFIVFSCFACKRNEDGPKPTLPPNYWGEAAAQKNGLLWAADPVCWVDIIDSNTVNIELDSFVDAFFLKESLTFHEIPRAAGSYDVFRLIGGYDGKSDASLYYFEGDVTLGSYHLIEYDTSNRLVIDSFDDLSKEIKGTFNLTFLVDQRPYPAAPDTIRFINGKFHGRLYK